MRKLSQKKKYLQVLKSKINLIESIKKKKYQALYRLLFKQELRVKNTYQENLNPFISFILSIVYSKTNTFVHLMDFTGKMIVFYSAGDVGYYGKPKTTDRIRIVRDIFKSYLRVVPPFMVNMPTALHLVNVGSYFALLHHLKKRFFIRSIRRFLSVPHNGCRLPKIRRVKIRTKKSK